MGEIMKQLFEYSTPEERRDFFLDTMEYHFGDAAPIQRIPIPPSIAFAPWFRDGRLGEIIEPYAVMGFKLPGVSGKVVAAFKILLALFAAGILTPDTTLVAATSGNFGYAMAILTNIRSLVYMFRIKGFIAVVEASTPQGKIDHLRRSGAHIVIAPEGRTAIEVADELGKQPGHYVVNQYTDINNVLAQEWVAKAIARAFGNKVSSYVVAMGSGASFAGGHRFLPKLVGKHVKIIGVASMPNKEEKVPGSRSEQGLVQPAFDYQSVPGYADYPLVNNVSKYEAFFAADEYNKALISVGPTGGLASAGFYKVLEQKVKAGHLSDLMNGDGRIVPVFLFMDMFLPYSDEYAKVLGES
jgi:cysteine synthase